MPERSANRENDEDTGITCFEEKLEGLKKGHNSDSAFMGFTHSVSSLALALAAIAFFPTLLFTALGTDNIWVLVMFVLTATGFVLYPDLDNSRSTVKSTFGIVGDVLSVVFRSSALVIQTIIRKRADDASPDPHRGFWHTIPSTLLMGGIIYWLTRIGGEVEIPYLGTFEWGTFIGFLIALGVMNLMLTGVFKKTMKKVKKLAGPLGTLISFVISALITGMFMMNIPSDVDMWWLAVACAFGGIVHILGDMFTRAGVPIFWPIIGLWRKKMWWKTRFFLTVEAGEGAENTFIAPAFVIISIGLFVKILISGVGG